MYPVIALIVLMVFTWIVAIWASCDGGEESHDEEHSGKGSEEQHDRDAA